MRMAFQWFPIVHVLMCFKCCQSLVCVNRTCIIILKNKSPCMRCFGPKTKVTDPLRSDFPAQMIFNIQLHIGTR